MADQPQQGWARPHNTPIRIGPYEIIGKLGGGGMATVYLGRTNAVGSFHRLFAVKRIHEHLSSDDAFAAMFLNEARIAAKIHHPGIVSVYDVGEDTGRLYIAMDYIRGETLSFVLNRAWKGGPGVPYHLMTFLLASACDALHLAHELRDDNGDFLGVIHRDLSPRNMMLGYDGFLRILDFGVAKAENQYPKTRTGTQKGTVAYMAPEQILGRTLDRRVDVFALGIVLWEATVGKRLFSAPNDFATAAKVRQAQIPPPTSLRPDYPPGLEKVVLKALRREPDDRYQNARELGDALRVFLATSPHLIASTDVSDLVHRLCSDRFDKRLEMERSGLEIPEQIVDDPSSGSISLNMSVALPEERGESDRDRTERLDSKTGLDPATTQNYSRDKTAPTPSLDGDDVPTAQAEVSHDDFGHSTARSRVKIITPGGTERTLDSIEPEPPTEHYVSQVRARDDETLEAHTDQEDQPSLDEISGRHLMFDGEPSVDDQTAGTYDERTPFDEDTHQPRFGGSLEEGTIDSMQDRPNSLETTDREAPRGPDDTETARQQEAQRHLARPPSTARDQLPPLEAPSVRSELDPSVPSRSVSGSVPQAPSVRSQSDATQPPSDVHEDPFDSIDTSRAEEDRADTSPPPPPPASEQSIERLDPVFLVGAADDSPDIDLAGLEEEPSLGEAPPIDAALAALASTSQLDEASGEYLDISRPKLNLDSQVSHRVPEVQVHRNDSPVPRSRSSGVSGAGFRAPSALESVDDPLDMPGSGLHEETLPPEASRVGAAPRGRGLKIFLMLVLLFLFSAILVVQVPAVNEALDEFLGVETVDAQRVVPGSESVAANTADESTAPASARPGPKTKAKAGQPDSVPVAEADLAILTFEVEPGLARVSLDGQRVEGKVEVPTSTRAHRLEVTAPGFTAVRRDVVADGDKTIKVALERR